jgi:hypothetical protein
VSDRSPFAEKETPEFKPRLQGVVPGEEALALTVNLLNITRGSWLRGAGSCLLYMVEQRRAISTGYKKELYTPIQSFFAIHFFYQSYQKKSHIHKHALPHYFPVRLSSRSDRQCCKISCQSLKADYFLRSSNIFC